MNNFSSNQQLFFILKRKTYRENQYLLDIFSENQGKMRAIATTPKINNYRNHDLLSPFHQLSGIFWQKNELAQIRNVEIDKMQNINKKLYLNACYMNELLISILPDNIALPEIFNFYQNHIANPDEIALRQLELQLILELDLFPEMNEKANYYRINYQQNPPCFVQSDQGFAYDDLINLQQGIIPNNPKIKIILQTIIKISTNQQLNKTRKTALALQKLLQN